MTTTKTILSKAGSRIRDRRTPAVAATMALLLCWCYLVLGPNLLAALLLGTGAVLGTVWTVRHHRPIALCTVITILTAAAFAGTCVVTINRQTAAAADAAAVLTGYLPITPVPALVACFQRPELVSAPRSTLIGSGVLLLSATPVILIGAYPLADVVLVAAAAAAAAVPSLRHRRAAAALTASLPTLHGWTDLGARRTPDGTHVDRLLLGAGAAIACSTADRRPVTDRIALTAARRAVTIADALGLPTHRVQPVILSATGTGGMRRHLVNDGHLAASVIIIEPDRLDQVIARVHPRRRGRRPVLTAALLPAPGEVR